MTYRTPCQRSETPEDWFIERDGRQYPDEEWVSAARIEEIVVAQDGRGLMWVSWTLK